MPKNEAEERTNVDVNFRQFTAHYLSDHSSVWIGSIKKTRHFYQQCMQIILQICRQYVHMQYIHHIPVTYQRSAANMTPNVERA